MTCELCHVTACCQEHLLSCIKLKQHVSIPSDVCYADIFDNTDKQLIIIRIFKKLLRTREILLGRSDTLSLFSFLSKDRTLCTNQDWLCCYEDNSSYDNYFCNRKNIYIVTSYGLPVHISMTSLGLPNLVSVTIGTRIFKKKFKKRDEKIFFKFSPCSLWFWGIFTSYMSRCLISVGSL